MAHQSNKVTANVTSYSPQTVDIKDPTAHHNKPDEHEDNTPSDSQPPGVDDEPQSLEEALVG